MADSRLSLVAAFDDLVRNTAVLTAGIEPEFIKFARHQESCRKHWVEAEQECGKLREKLKKVEAEKNALETKLKHARGQIDYEMRKRQKVEHQKESLERQIDLIRELLINDGKGHTSISDHDRERLFSICQTTQVDAHHKRLETINESSQSILSDISYDKTEEDLDITYLRNGRKYKKRPSAPPAEDERETPPKKKRSRSRSKGRGNDELNTSVTATTTITIPDSGVAHATCEVSSNLPHTEMKLHRKKTMRRSFSESNAIQLGKEEKAEESDDSFWGISSRGRANTMSGNTPGSPGYSPAMRHFNSAGRNLTNKAHSFQSKTVIKPEMCIPCGKRVKFGRMAMKCKYCRATCHPDCKDQVPLPCIPAPSTPGGTGKNQGIISDYTPAEPPMIPAILIHCVNEVESRGLSEVGIYRVPGSDNEVKDLKEKFLRGKGYPNLAEIRDIHVICSCLKDFLRSLKEPLVTYRLWGDFVRAAETISDNEEKLSATYQAISQLPQSNRDSLAFLVLHLQRVAECPECKMPISNLAKVFGPTVVGYSSPEPEPMQMITEAKKQAAVMEVLISIPSDYWDNFIQAEEDALLPRLSQHTPETRPVPHSMLGPLNTPGSNRGSISKKIKNTWNTPKFGSKSKTANKRPTHFFSSPMLK